ncbi:MAG: hypothetical protein C4535_20245 [Comamonadaceae bacterium]|nr:MAG: hypothetical protein C4535_20245 [Comamonadaceae bacterium]
MMSCDVCVLAVLLWVKNCISSTASMQVAVAPNQSRRCVLRNGKEYTELLVAITGLESDLRMLATLGFPLIVARVTGCMDST